MSMELSASAVIERVRKDAYESGLVVGARRAQEWQSIDTAPRDGTEVLLKYERSEDLPEPWPLVIIAHCDREGFWVWQHRAARSYGAAPIGWQPIPPLL